MGSLVVFVRDTGARELLGHKPDLKLVDTKNVANQQVIGSVVAACHRGSSRLASCINDEFVSLQQTE